MIFLLAFVLFMGGIACFALAFNVEDIQSLVFFAGIALVSIAVAIPVHMLRTGNSR